MDLEYEKQEVKPLPGWACVAIGLGFVAFLVVAVAGVRVLAGG